MVRYQLGTASLGDGDFVVVAIGGVLYPATAVLDAPGSVAGPPPPDTLAGILDDWAEWRPRLTEAVARFSAGPASSPLEPTAIRWKPPIPSPRKILCIGSNYKDHDGEMAFAPPTIPYAFLKPITALAAHGAEITLLKHAKMNDWEAELAVVVGRRCRDVPEAEALGVVAGYTLINDVSARDWIDDRPSLGIDWVVQKASDGYAPMGPLMTPAEFVPNPQALDIELTLNGAVMQRANTREMLFPVRTIIAHLSKFLTLEPGDVIATGTPSGTGFGRKPRVFLKPGDVTRVTIGELGTLENRFV